MGVGGERWNKERGRERKQKVLRGREGGRERDKERKNMICNSCRQNTWTCYNGDAD